MFAKEWASHSYTKTDSKAEKVELPKYEEYIDKIAPLMWGEHCVECAVPDCYEYCKLYRPRLDKRCKLFEQGIATREEYKGVLGSSVEIQFSKWAKLEAFCNVGQHKLKYIKKWDRFLTKSMRSIKFLDENIPESIRKWKLTSIYYKVREGIVRILGYSKCKPEALVIGMINEGQPFKMIIETKTKKLSKYRYSVMANQGYSQYIIPYSQLNISEEEMHYIFVYPEEKEKSTSITFTALDLVTFKEGKAVELEAKGLNRERKVKCVVWDLDNTLWSGVLIEDEIQKNNLNQKAIELIKALDQRGIVNSICSKNSKEEACQKLSELGILEYFVGGQINWEPKSINMKRIVDTLNIGIDTLAFIDDSPFERSEVLSVYPMIRCFDIKDIVEILDRPEFDVPVTEDSKNRRQTYKMLEQRSQMLEEWTGNIDDFLRSCQMQMTLGKPAPHEVLRCFELLQRTNQLNISGRRLTLEQVEKMINNLNVETFVIECKDIFGDYGIVGFIAIDLTEEEPVLTDLVISCRVANKKIEHTLIQWLEKRYQKEGCHILILKYKPTHKNGPLSKVFGDLGCVEERGGTEEIIYQLDLQVPIEEMNIVKVNERNNLEDILE